VITDEENEIVASPPDCGVQAFGKLSFPIEAFGIECRYTPIP